MVGLALFISQIKFKTNTKLLQNVVLILLAFFFVKSFGRLTVYKNNDSFIEAGLKERPDYYLFHQQKAEVLYKQKDFYKANQLFSKAIELRPDKAELYSNRGSCEFALRMYPEAIRDFSEAINKSDFKMEYYLNRCVVYNKINDLPNALKDYEVLKKCCSAQIPAALENDLKAKMSSIETTTIGK